ncbi:MAG: dehydrogenase [Acidobacteria bacterium]|nr:MAG: dehydrogenase [Acidobacteriota bacterium]
MGLEATNVPLSAKDFDRERVGLCAGCGCGCGYIIYLKDNKIVDLYGNPSDPRGMGSLCTKGITYIQELPGNSLRLKGIFLREGEGFREIDHSIAISILRDKLSVGKTAFLLGRQAGLEEYLLARSLSDELFVDAPVVDFLPSTVNFTEWKDARFILSIDAEPVFSEVMSTRWIVDAIEKGAYLFCLSSRYETLCAKAKQRLVLKPDLMVNFLYQVISPEKAEGDAESVKRWFFLLRGSLLLIGSHLLLSPFRGALLYALSQISRKFSVNYSLVGDLMPFPAKELREFFNRLEEFDNLVVIGNLFRYLSDEHLRLMEDKFIVSFQTFPNVTAHHSNLVFGATLFHEREFINYRHGFGFLLYSPQTLRPEEGIYNPYHVLSEVYRKEVNLYSFLQEYGIELEELKGKEEGVRINLPKVESLKYEPKDHPKSELYLYTDSGLVEDMGHWNPWTHDMERFQRAYINPRTARDLGLKDSVSINERDIHISITKNVAEGVIFISSEYEEYQPFDPGVRVGNLHKDPCNRYETLR